MSAIVKPASSPLLADRLARLRLQVMAGELAALVGRNIRAARLARPDRPNQRQLAEEIRKLDPQMAAQNTTVSEWERGIRKPDDRYMPLLSKVLERPVDWFYRDHDEGTSETPDPFAQNGNEPVELEPGAAELRDLVMGLRDLLIEAQDDRNQARAEQMARVGVVLRRLDDIEDSIRELQRRRPA